MTDTFATLKDQTLALREMILRVAEPLKPKADVVPPQWSNNLRWHLGHLVVTPRLLTHGLLGEPLGVPEAYRSWFAKGTSPLEWSTHAGVPSASQLIEEVVAKSAELFDALASRREEAFAEPYRTSVGVVLRTPGEALGFSLAHDGIHLGLLLALRRNLSED